MNRRELFRSLGTVVAAAGIPLTPSVLRRRPDDLYAVLSCPGPVSESAKENLRKSWNALHNGRPPLKLIVLEEGMQLKICGPGGVHDG